MISFIVVWYEKSNPLLDAFKNNADEPGDYRSFDNLEDALHCMDLNIFTGYTVEMWMWETKHREWYRLRFQSNYKDHNNYVG